MMWYEHLFGTLALLFIIASPYLLLCFLAKQGDKLGMPDDREWYD